MEPIVDPDDDSTWPEEVVRWVRATADAVDNDVDHTGNLALPFEGEDEFRALFSGYLVRAYHATRLLPHEEHRIREGGLRLLSEGLVRDRINAAREFGHISAELHAHLLDSPALRYARSKNRTGQICLYLSEHTMEEQAHGLWRLLATWGGEAIYWDNEVVVETLRRLGRPSVVVAALDLSLGWRTHQIWPGLREVFLGHWLGLEGTGASVHYHVNVPGDHILGIWHPGDPEYDRFDELHRT
jgi:hypothetical protein